MKMYCNKRQALTALVGAMVMAGFWCASTASASTITAKVNTDAGASTSDDRMDPDVWWTSGNFAIITQAAASDPKGVASAATNWPAAGLLPKSGLLVDVDPTTAGAGGTSIIPGSDLAPASGSGADYAASGATSPGLFAWAYSYGYAYLDTTLVDEYEMNVHAYGFATALVTDNANAQASIVDPFAFGWDDAESHTLIASWNLQPGTLLEIDQATIDEGVASAGFTVTSQMGVYNAAGDLLHEQLFWSLTVAGDSLGAQVVDVALGEDVFLYGNPLSGASLIDYIESEISSNWISDGMFSVGSSSLFPFAYTADIGESGFIAYSYDIDGFATASAVPLPATIPLLFIGGLAMMWTRPIAKKCLVLRG